MHHELKTRSPNWLVAGMSAAHEHVKIHHLTFWQWC